MSIQENHQNYHHQLQERLLLSCNILFLFICIFLASASLLTGNLNKAIIAILVGVVLGCSIFLLYSDQYTSATYITALGMTLACYGVLLGQNPRNELALYEFVAFEALALGISGFIARQRHFTFIITAIALILLLYYIFVIQVPLIGLDHRLYIINAVTIISLLGILSDQIYLLTGNIFNKFLAESEIVVQQQNNINSITSIYKYNKNSRVALNDQYIAQDTYLLELNNLNDTILENAASLNSILNDLLSANDKHLSTSQNVTVSFSKHKKNMENYKDQLQEISDTSQEIDTMFQNKRQQLSELIDMSQQGQDRMANSINAVKKVTENSKNILDMISLIMEVAERTNVLALNAAVEASRAGKAGGGFAIVAKEIKKLSTETSHNADIINKTLRINMQSIEETVDIIKQTDQSLSSINQIIIDFSHTIEQIVNRISFLTNQSVQMSIGTTNIISIIGEVQQVIHNTVEILDNGNSKINDMRNISNILAEKSKQLQLNSSYIKNTSNKTQQAFLSYVSSVKQIEDTIEKVEIIDQN